MTFVPQLLLGGGVRAPSPSMQSMLAAHGMLAASKGVTYVSFQSVKSADAFACTLVLLLLLR